MEKMQDDAAGPDDTPELLDAAEDDAAFLDYIRDLIAELEEVYRSPISREEKLLRKEEIIEGAKARFEINYETIFKTENYRGFSEMPVNNAYLELFNLYYEENMFYKDLYDRTGRDLPKFIAAAITLKGNRLVNRGKGNPKEELERALLGTRD